MRSAAVAVVLGVIAGPVFAQTSNAYRLSFPEPEHHWMQVELTLPDLPATPLE